MYRTSFVLLGLIMITHVALFGQTADKFSVFNEEWKSTTVKKAVYLTHQKKISDTCWETDVYNFKGPMIRMERYKDRAGKIAHGKFAFYNTNGRIDSICHFANGLAHGDWYLYNDTGKVIYKKEYLEGRLIGEKDLLKEEAVKKDEVVDKNEKESEFPGGAGGWRNYLVKNLRYPQRAIDMNKQGQVSVMFIVDKDGKIADPVIFNSVEFSLDEESMRIINNCPKWVPARQFGRHVKTYKIQPVIYRLTK